MKFKDLQIYVWEVIFVILVAVVLANYWIGYNMRNISPLPAKFPIAFIIAPLCGACVYLFIKKVHRAFYATVAMCALACVFTALFILLPCYSGLLDFGVGIALSLRFTVIMAIFVFPLSIGGAFVAAYLYPE